MNGVLIAIIVGLGAACLLVGLVRAFGGKQAPTQPASPSPSARRVEASARRAEPPSVDFSQPMTEAMLKSLKIYKGSQEFSDAADRAWQRYRFASNPMLLANTISTTMRRYRLDVFEAIIRMEQDAVREDKVG